MLSRSGETPPTPVVVAAVSEACTVATCVSDARVTAMPEMVREIDHKRSCY